MFPADLISSGSHLLSCLIWLPTLGALLMFLVPEGRECLARKVAFGTSAVVFAGSLCLYKRFVIGSAAFQFAENVSWIPSLGIRYQLGVDGLSLWLVMLTALLTMLVVAASGSIEKKVRSYLGCLLFLETGMLGALLALDLITFYVFWELMLIPMYFLIGVWGGARRLYAAIKFVLFTAAGSLLMLVAIVFMGYQYFKQTGVWSFYTGDWTHLMLNHHDQVWLFAAFALAFAIKIPLFPLHTWLPDAHVEAPTGGSVILAGILLKLGLYGLLRFCVPLFPQIVIESAPLFMTLGVIGIVFGALVAWVQTDVKKLVAYSSVSHLGFCVLGFSALNLIGLQGSMLQMINHGVSTAALFLIVGVLYDRKHTREISNYGGLSAKVPLFAAVFLVFTLSSIGLPLTNGFIGEFLILLGGFQANKTAGIIAVSGVVLGAMYMLSLYRRMMYGRLDEAKNGDLEDLTWTEKLIFVPLLALVFVIGLYPQIFLRVLEPSSNAVLKELGRVAVAPATALLPSEGAHKGSAS